MQVLNCQHNIFNPCLFLISLISSCCTQHFLLHSSLLIPFMYNNNTALCPWEHLCGRGCKEKKISKLHTTQLGCLEPQHCKCHLLKKEKTVLSFWYATTKPLRLLIFPFVSSETIFFICLYSKIHYIGHLYNRAGAPEVCTSWMLYTQTHQHNTVTSVISFFKTYWVSKLYNDVKQWKQVILFTSVISWLYC